MDRGSDVEFLAEGGRMGAAMRAHDWTRSKVGPPRSWPLALRIAINLILNSPESMFVAWGPSLTFFFNDAYVPILGPRLDGALGAAMPTLWSDVWDDVRPIVEKALAGEASRYEDQPSTMVRHGVAEPTWWSFSYSPLRDETGRAVGLFCVTSETTRRVLAAAAQAEANERLQMALSAGDSIGTWDWDIPNDRVVADARFARLYGVDAGKAARGAPIDEFFGGIAPEDLNGVRDAIDTAMRTGLPFAAEYRLVQTDGSIRWVAAQGRCISDEAGTPLRFPGVSFDITDRKMTQERLQRLNETLENEVAKRTTELQVSEARLRAIFETSYTLKGLLDTDGRVIDINATALSAMETTLADVKGGLFWDTPWFSRTPGMVDRIRAAVAAAGRGEIVRQEISVEVSAGLRSYDLSLGPMRDRHGAIVALLPEAIDTTDRRLAEEALRQSQKLEAVGQLTGGVAHDFNNLLTVIRSSIDLLKRPNLAEERRQRYIEAISDTATRAAKLTGQLLAFARRQALQPEVFDVASGIASISDMVGALTGSRIRIETRVPDLACYINADPSQFDTAVVNLAVNARDAMSGEGVLTIGVSTTREIPATRSHHAVAGNFVAVSVADTGAGIPPDHMDRIFEPFFTTKDVGLGTGLGLSQVFGFVKQSGGDISVASVLDAGTVFTLYLPRVDTPPAPAAPRVGDEAPVDGHGTCVLVVEDNTEVGAFATQTLKELGYRSVLAGDAAAALAELEADAARFDVVFSDVVMPGMNGIALGQQIRRLYPTLPVVLTSGYSHVLAESGPHGFELLNKPYSIEQLSRILQKASQRRWVSRGRGA